jgi:putative inorganic carbon (hco3(-)) transporter
MSNWLLTGYLIFLPIQIDFGVGFRFAPSDLLLVAYVLSLKSLSICRSRWSDWHLGILLVFTLGLITAQIREGEITRYAILQKYVGLFVLLGTYWAMVTAAKDWDAIRRMVRTFTVSVVIQNTIMLSVFLLGMFLGVTVPGFNVGGTRLQGMLHDPNAYGGLLVFTFALLIANEDFDSSKHWQWARRFGMTSISIGLLLTFSRSAWIGFIAVLGCMVLMGRKKILGVISMIVLAGLIIVLAADEAFQERILAMSSRPDQIDVRLEIIEKAIEQFERAPITGIGLGTFTNYCDHIIHNTPLWFMTELGLLGLVCFLGFFYWFVKKGWSARQLGSSQQSSLILGMLMAHCAMLGLSMGIEAFYQRHWWLVMALLASSHAILSAKDATKYTVVLPPRTHEKFAVTIPEPRA